MMKMSLQGCSSQMYHGMRHENLTGMLSKRCLMKRRNVWKRHGAVGVVARQGVYGSRVSTPHSGYHWDGSDRRFFEGWYWRVTLPGEGQSFALIFSVEDPSGRGQFSGVGAQVMGPGDGYLIQYSTDVSCFWADRSSLALGASFDLNENGKGDGKGRSNIVMNTVPRPRGMIPKDTFDSTIAHGFQASTRWQQGNVIAKEDGAAGNLNSTVAKCRWAFAINPVIGWGDVGERQRATAGWLATLPIFEPHWQVLMAHGEATGWIEWGDKRYTFSNAPTYAEKNWGGGFPYRWGWIQCNSFKGFPGTSVTAVGARRGLINTPDGKTLSDENVGLIGIHHEGKFYELNVKDSEIEWDVNPWGKWVYSASNKKYKAVLEAKCESPGTPLRAPTADSGLAPFCRDSFYGEARLRLWKFEDDGSQDLFIDVVSHEQSAAVEVGGGPWDSNWKVKAKMSEPIQALLNLPFNMEAMGDLIPPGFRPPGL